MSSKRRPSSARWLAEHENDPYVQEARRRGYRSRAVFKLQEIDERDRLFKPGLTVVDLGAAPGGWSQYAGTRIGPGGRLLALDVLPMEPLPGVDFIQGDFREDAALKTLENRIGSGRMVDLVLSDMAPNISGIDVADQATFMLLAELALEFAKTRLRPRGVLLVKLFQGEGFDNFLKMLRDSFETVVIRKPRASRQRSREVYALARNPRVE
ncbi:MAG: 23S rRNA (uridine(2552)-2'-O)-methyltransferase RlmE [Nevskiales bacterium]|nr:23S rRNA (uridine(2552)-2'-O)-methyltransferase RlmE [Nevskiales bacterium]